MRSDELIATVRMDTTDEDAHPDYTDARIIIELNDSFTTKFQRSIVDSRGQFWQQATLITPLANQTRIRLPARAIKLAKVEIGTGSGSATQYNDLLEITEDHASYYEAPAVTTGKPQWYVSRGDQLELVPVPDVGTYTIRLKYYIRPNRLVTSQSSTLGGAAADRGRITAINTGARTLTVNALPFDYSLGTPAAIASASQTIDVVHPDGWHELALVGASQTIAGLVITVGGTDPLDRVAIGDYVRVAGQTDWPPIPDDFHRCLADITAAKILIQEANPDKAAGIVSDVNADFERFSALLTPRNASMTRRTDELIATVRLNCGLDDDDENYPDYRIQIELNAAFQAKFPPVVRDAKANYWLQTQITTPASGTQRVRIPPRAIAIAQVSIGIGSGSATAWYDMPEVNEWRANLYEWPVSILGRPNYYVVRGDQLEFTNVTDGNYQLRVRYYIRPSKVVTSQYNLLLGAGADRGRVTSVNAATRVVGVNALPFDYSQRNPAAITTANQLIDIVHPNGWHELALVGATQTISGLNITVGGTDDLTEVAVGDYVRVAEQTDWYPVSDEWLRTIADAASIGICIQKGDNARGAALAASVTGDMQRFAMQIGKRVDYTPRTIRADLPSLRRRW
jgi:hypothetical protein